ncbi:hypothetical protein BgiMline_028303 [Biomphalaria glabrata]
MGEIFPGHFYTRNNMNFSDKVPPVHGDGTRFYPNYQQMFSQELAHFSCVNVAGFIESEEDNRREHVIGDKVCLDQRAPHWDSTEWREDRPDRHTNSVFHSTGTSGQVDLFRGSSPRVLPLDGHQMDNPGMREITNHRGNRQHSGTYVIRARLSEKDQIKRLVLPGNVVQVCGPPMVGKSVLVDQVVEEIRESNQNLEIFSINCKHLNSLQQVLIKVHKTLFEATTTLNPVDLEDTARFVKKIKSVLQVKCCSHHVFVFHKTETLRHAGEDHAFLDFLSGLVRSDCQVHVTGTTAVFTTFQQFPVIGEHVTGVQVGMLTDPLDILTFLQHYAPGSCVRDYVDICQRFLCLPEAVRRLAEEYLSISSQRPPPGNLLSIVCRDKDLLYHIFHKRATEVKSWIGNKRDFDFLTTLVQSSLNVLTEESIREIYQRRNLHQNYEDWSVCYRQLLKKYILLRSRGTHSLSIHPLVLYYCNMHGLRPHSSSVNDHSTKSHTQLLCRVLMKTDKAMLSISPRGHVFGCKVKDWPYTKQLMQTAIQDATGGYKAFLKVAVSAREVIISSCPNEAKAFYTVLLHSARCYGTSSQVAVVEACLALTITISKDADCKSSDQHFESALKVLKANGPTFFYRWAQRKRGITLHRQGYHMKSLEAFKESKMIPAHLAMLPSTDDILSVPDSQADEDLVSAQIHESIPLIFTGENIKARNMLLQLKSSVPDIEHHPDYSILLNSIGLTLERAENKIQEALVWYQKSVIARKPLRAISPEILTIPMVNIGMAFFQTGQFDKCEKCLQQVIAIRRQTEWQHFYTALTLFNLGIMKWTTGRASEAFNDVKEALNILQKKSTTHHFTLAVRLALSHIQLTRDVKGNQGEDTVVDHLQKMAQFHQNFPSHNSNEEQHCMLSFHEHQLIIHWKNSKETFDFHKRCLSKMFQNMSRMPSKFPACMHLAERETILDYVQTTGYDSLDYNYLMRHMRNVCRFCQIIASVYNLNAWSLVFDELLGKKTILSASQCSVDQSCKARINHFQAAITKSYESETQRKCVEYPNPSFKSSSLLRKLSHQLSQTIERDNSNTLVKRSGYGETLFERRTDMNVTTCRENYNIQHEATQGDWCAHSNRKTITRNISLLHKTPIMQASHTVATSSQNTVGSNNTSCSDNNVYRLNRKSFRDISGHRTDSSTCTGNDHRLRHNGPEDLGNVNNEPPIIKETSIVARAQPVTTYLRVAEVSGEEGSHKSAENSSLSSSVVVELHSCREVDPDYTDLPELVSLNSSIVRDFYVDL